MTLQEFLKREYYPKYPTVGEAEEAFAKVVGYSLYAIRKWKSGERFPRTNAIMVMEEGSGGQVKLKDHWKVSLAWKANEEARATKLAAERAERKRTKKTRTRKVAGK